jgi:hypothetical protein
MATTKRVQGDYTIKSVDLNVDSFTIDRFAEVRINGDLVVTGNTTQVETTNTTITDNIIVLNQGETGNGVTRLFSGIQVDRGIMGNVVIRWNEIFNLWQLTTNGTSFSNIASYGTVPFISNIADDTSPQLGGNLDVQNYQIYSSTAETVVFNDNVAIAQTSVAPTTLSGNVVMYAQTAGGGGSGLYVNNESYTEQELATKSKAITYSIIFG